MYVDMDSLEALNLLARDGTERANRALADLTGASTAIGSTRILLVDREDVVERIETGGYEVVRFDIAGTLSGTALLLFDRPATEAVVDALVGGAEDGMGSAALKETANILMGAFTTDWGDHLGTGLEMTAPTYLDDPDADALQLDPTGPETDSALVFHSSITWRDAAGRIDVYLAPDRAALDPVFAETDADEAEEPADAFDPDEDGLFGIEEGTDSIPLEKLSVFSDLTKEGSAAAAERVTEMTGVETETELAGIAFTPVDDVAAQLGDGDYVGTTVAFEGTPSGSLIVLFDRASATNIAEAMLPIEPDGDGFTDMHESAIEELGNVMTSGFIDGWANVLETGVEHTPPEYVGDVNAAVLELVTEQLGPFQTHAFTIESTLRTEDVAFSCEIHALPDEADLGAALEALAVERKDQTDADPDDLF
ncbi:chemotaxis protein CheC [Halorientalis halophila]|uniref:chemotaxis protein CheC n=1 Tax=Halorientalis halophila TaxID=3108499 RepID=UPI00300B98A0